MEEAPTWIADDIGIVDATPLDIDSATQKLRLDNWKALAHEAGLKTIFKYMASKHFAPTTTTAINGRVPARPDDLIEQAVTTWRAKATRSLSRNSTTSTSNGRGGWSSPPLSRMTSPLRCRLRKLTCLGRHVSAQLFHAATSATDCAHRGSAQHAGAPRVHLLLGQRRALLRSEHRRRPRQPAARGETRRGARRSREPSRGRPSIIGARQAHQYVVWAQVAPPILDIRRRQDGPHQHRRARIGSALLTR